MVSPSRLMKLIVICIVITGCAQVPEAPDQIAQTDVVSDEGAPADPQQLAETAPPVIPTAMFTPGLKLPEADRVVFTIQNGEPWFGREGDPRPDWLAWGAETFTVAPDGSFWIADTAVDPPRLLRFNPQGELLDQISLENLVVYPYDLIAAKDILWTLDVSADPPRVVQLDAGGKKLGELEIPRELMEWEGEFVANGAFNLWIGEDGSLILSAMKGLYELVDASGETIFQPLEALSYAGHTYRAGIYDEASGRVPIYVDGDLFETPTDFFVEGEPFLGFNPDGSFAITGYVQDPTSQVDYQVKFYTPAGKLLGTARQYPQTFHKDFNHHLAFGPDGSVYQLLSNPDHSVQVVRLGFPEELPPREPPITVSPTPLSVMLPSEPEAADEEQARNVLVAFFYELYTGDYEAAAARFGGEVGEYAREPLPGETAEQYWEYLCGFLWCLPVAEITDAEQVSENEFLFYVVFVHTDGSRFEIGACCGGDPAATPPVWQFAYPVQKIEGEWKVMRGPLFTP